MLDIMFGDRVAKALRDSYKLDGCYGKVQAVCTVFIVATSMASAVVGLVSAVI